MICPVRNLWSDQPVCLLLGTDLVRPAMGTPPDLVMFIVEPLLIQGFFIGFCLEGVRLRFPELDGLSGDLRVGDWRRNSQELWLPVVGHVTEGSLSHPKAASSFLCLPLVFQTVLFLLIFLWKNVTILSLSRIKAKKITGTKLSTQATFKPVEKFNEFIWTKLMTIAGKQNLTRLRKCCGAWQFCSLFYTLESIAWNPLVVD